uniref:BRCA1-A complex subunit Abraxas 1 n=1 Tax=Oncorhynchus mykiss TaxID=8022 RepID=A0A8C7UAJ4_ONCMY
MADLNSSVRISGFVLGSLMFHHFNSDFNSDSDVEGLIPGESKAEARSNITDSQIDNIQFEHTISGSSAVHLNHHNYRGGEPNEVRHLLSNYKEENVIGWYKQQRYTDQQITFREQVIHENLKRAVSNQELMFLLLTPSEVTSSGSTHKLGVCSLQITFSQSCSVPVRVSNLGLLEQQDYWRPSASCSSVNYNRVSSLRTVSERKQEQKKSMTNFCCSIYQFLICYFILLLSVKHVLLTLSQSQETVLLCEAIKTLFPGAALLQTQALTFQGFPVPEFCCNTDHGIDITTTLPLILTHTVPKARKGRLGRGGGTSWRKRPLWESSDTPKRRKNMLEETEGSSLSVSGSETEDDLIPANQNRNNLDMSNRGQKCTTQIITLHKSVWSIGKSVTFPSQLLKTYI